MLRKEESVNNSSSPDERSLRADEMLLVNKIRNHLMDAVLGGLTIEFTLYSKTFMY